jgi:integral membrane protein (TIGR01906 family)
MKNAGQAARHQELDHPRTTKKAAGYSSSREGGIMKTPIRIAMLLLFPIILLLGWVRIMLLPVFIQVEYRRPGFPPDPFGFTTQERIHWADISRTYLLSSAGPEYFSPYPLTDGSPLYNDRELKHLADVRILVEKGMQILVVSGGLFLAGCAFLFWKDRTALRKTIALAGISTILFWVILLSAVALLWNQAFVAFHQVFFSGSTWLFPYSDTLIRLFPEAFWQDGFATAVIGMLLSCLIVWLAAGGIPGWIIRFRRIPAGKSP